MNFNSDNRYQAGHRRRLKQKVLSGVGSLLDYELLEALLFFVFVRIDTKLLAKKLLTRFGGFSKLLSADAEELKSIDGVGESTVIFFALLKEVLVRVHKSKVQKNPVIATSKDVQHYYRVVLGETKKEQLRIMFLDVKKRLICEKMIHAGTVSKTAVYPREIVHSALECGASGLIIVHNHPSGDVLPSRQDVIMTKRIQEIAEKLEMCVVDHLVVGRENVVSMKELGLL